MEEQDVFQEMANKWPSAVVARVEVERFTGGLISAKYMANLDSLKLGCNRITCGRKVGYSVRDLVVWLRARSNKSVVSG